MSDSAGRAQEKPRRPKPQRKDSDYLTVAEVAAQLNLSAPAVYRLTVCGDLTTYKFGGSIRIHKTDLAKYIQKSRIKFPGRPLKKYDEEPNE